MKLRPAAAANLALRPVGAYKLWKFPALERQTRHFRDFEQVAFIRAVNCSNLLTWLSKQPCGSRSVKVNIAEIFASAKLIFKNDHLEFLVAQTLFPVPLLESFGIQHSETMKPVMNSLTVWELNGEGPLRTLPKQSILPQMFSFANLEIRQTHQLRSATWCSLEMSKQRVAFSHQCGW